MQAVVDMTNIFQENWESVLISVDVFPTHFLQAALWWILVVSIGC
jgi:hypothetical protein